MDWRSFTTFLSLGGVLAVWWIVAQSGIVNQELFPSPGMVGAAALEMEQNGVLWSDLEVSLTRVAVGFGIGALLGIFVGLLTSRMAFFQYSFHPVLTLLRPIPAIALPIAIIWLGIGEGSKYFVISYTVVLAVIPTAQIASHRSLEDRNLAFGLGGRVGAIRRGYMADVLLIDVDTPEFTPSWDLHPVSVDHRALQVRGLGRRD